MFLRVFFKKWRTRVPEFDPDPDPEFHQYIYANFEAPFKNQSPRMCNDQTSKFAHAKLLGSNSGSGSKEISLRTRVSDLKHLNVNLTRGRAKVRTGALFSVSVDRKIMGSRNFAPGCFGLNKASFCFL